MKGFDYGMGQTNIDRETGIRYGVISQHSISGEALFEMELDYGELVCPDCGMLLVDDTDEEYGTNGEDTEDHSNDEEYWCVNCDVGWGFDQVDADEPVGMYVDDGIYKVRDCLNSDLMVSESPYFTFAEFCSPCVPGAGDLNNTRSDGVKTYCLGHDWFENGKAPYPVYSVETGEEVKPT